MTEIRIQNPSSKHGKTVTGVSNVNCIVDLMKTIPLNIFFFIRYYIDVLIDKIFGFYYDGRKQTVPPPSNPLVQESATSLARKIRKREVTVEEVVQAFIERINEVNNILNAVVDVRFDEALKEAKQIDKDIASGHINDSDFQAKPFLGVPFTSKESTAAQGMSYTFGLVSRRGFKAKEDAEIVRLMKEAGGILLGVTNIPQVNMWQETSNPVFGLTKNPYDTTRNVGGSSGGEASIIAACGSPFGIGTDIGGSLRIPSFMCGIFGHKPTCDLISTRGMTFRTGQEKNTMVVAGPMAKYAEDLIPFLKVLLGANVHKLTLDKPVDIKNIQVFYISDPKDPFVSPMRKNMQQKFTSVIEYFQQNWPWKPQELCLEGMKRGGKLWRYWMTQEPNYDLCVELANRNGRVGPWKEILKYIFCQSNYTAAIIINLLNGILPKEKEQWAREQTKLLKMQLLEKLSDYGVLLYPSAPWTAGYHHTALLRPWNFNYFSIWNALKFPVTQVPLGLDENGLPMGIQVVAAPYHDHLAIAVAKELERQFGGYVPPFSRSE